MILGHRGHSAAEPQPKEITPSLPSPLEGEGEGGGDSLQNLKNLNVSSTESTEKRNEFQVLRAIKIGIHQIQEVHEGKA